MALKHAPLKVPDGAVQGIDSRALRPNPSKTSAARVLSGLGLPARGEATSAQNLTRTQCGQTPGAEKFTFGWIFLVPGVKYKA